MPDRKKLLPERLRSSIVGSTVAEYRRFAQVPAVVMAQGLQCNASTLRRWETDTIPMRVDDLIRYLRRLDLYLVITDTEPPEFDPTTRD